MNARFNWYTWTAKTNVRGTVELGHCKAYETHVLKI